jgi:peptidoglycan/xylan/chitin deacetylase (PgdA/CDA1 family)
MTASDIFNGVPAARFDYVTGVAYLSVPFSSGSDSIFLRVLQGTSELPMNYIGVSVYYDNRRAAVTVTLDDWNATSNNAFVAASQILSDAQVHYTAGIITYGYPNWDHIQQWLDQGYLEVGSHSRTHPCSQSDYLANGYDWEIEKSRDDLLTNLNLLHPYIPAYSEPCGFTNAQVRQAIVSSKYLVSRGWQIPPAENGFSGWGSDGAYQRTMYSYDTFSWGEGDATNLNQANQSFDAVYFARGIYHLVDHPSVERWLPGSYLSQHITYLSHRPDVWYVPFGGLYLYHFVTERGLMHAYAVGNPNPLPTTIITNPYPPTAHTITEWPENKRGAVSITFDDAMASQVSLAVPALDTRGLKGTFFLVPTQADYDGTWDGWRAAAAEGHEMGSHSMTHANLTQISSSALEYELHQSQASIDAQIPTQNCLTFAYPFGAYNDTVVSATMGHYIAARITGWEGEAEPYYRPYDFYRLS